MKLYSNSLLYRYLCLACAILVFFATLPVHAAADEAALEGKATADEAAAMQRQARPAPAAGPQVAFPGAQPDSLPPAGGYFEEEEEGKHLYRDIGIFLIVSAFVGYFLVKVFLEGETEEQTTDDGGKDIPNPFSAGFTF